MYKYGSRVSENSNSMRAAAKPDMFEISCNITKWTLGVQKHLQNNAFNGTWRKHGGAKHACCHISALVPLKASEGVCEALFCWLYMFVFYVR